jgi:hypothetical protein
MEQEAPARTPLMRRVLAFLVLVIAAVIAIKIVVGLVMSVFWILLGVAVVIAILWALKTLAW